MAARMSNSILPVPGFFNPASLEDFYRVDYEARFADALAMANQFGITPAGTDTRRIALLIIDAQGTFCHPKAQLYVGGRSGRGAVEDNRRLVEFMYQNLGVITDIFPTMDTHKAFQIFHRANIVDANGKHPDPMTFIELADVTSGRWRVNPRAVYAVTGDTRAYAALQAQFVDYVEKLSAGGRYALTVWPFHSMLGGPDHALVGGVEEACFIHSVARGAATGFEIKGGNPLSENYSVLSPEVLTGPGGKPIAQRNTKFIEKLINYDVVVIAGQAKSHCVAWSIRDLLNDIQARDPQLASKVYLLEDCTSPVVVPGIVDFTDQADEAFRDFAAAGMHLVKSTTPLADWPDMKLAA